MGKYSDLTFGKIVNQTKLMNCLKNIPTSIDFFQHIRTANELNQVTNHMLEMIDSSIAISTQTKTILVNKPQKDKHTLTWMLRSKR